MTDLKTEEGAGGVNALTTKHKMKEKSDLRAPRSAGIHAWVKRTADAEFKKILRACSCNPGTEKPADVIGSFACFL